MDKKNISIVVAVVIIVAGVAFYGGIKYGQSKILRRGQGNPLMMNFDGREKGTFQVSGGANGTNRGGLRFNGSFINGEIIAKDDKSLTIKMNDGGSKIVFYSESTVVNKNIEGLLTDLKVGDNIMASGNANQDGSVTAQTIQLRPTMPVPTPTPSQ